MSRNHAETERVVVIGAPTFGQGVKFILFGAALGFGAAYYLLGGVSKRSVAKRAATSAKQKAAAAASAKIESASEALEETIEEVGENVEDRLKSLARRVRDLSHTAKELVDSAGEAVKPAIERAVVEGKKAAAEAESRLKKDLEKAGDKPVLAAEDEKDQSEKLPDEKKKVE